MPADDGPLWNVRNEWTTITEPNGLRPWLTEAGITVGYDQILGVEVVILYRPATTEWPTGPLASRRCRRTERSGTRGTGGRGPGNAS